MYVLLVVILLFLVGWDLVWWGLGVKPIFPKELKKLLYAAGGEPPLLIDVRSKFEYDIFHIEGAVNEPAIFQDHRQLQSLSKDAPIVVICISGHRSPIAGYFLRQQGFKNVSHLVWGMLSWVVSRGSTVSSEGHAADQQKHQQRRLP